MEKEKYQIWIGKVFLSGKEPLREIKIFCLNDCKEWGFVRTERWARKVGKEYGIPVFRTKTYSD